MDKNGLGKKLEDRDGLGDLLANRICERLEPAYLLMFEKVAPEELLNFVLNVFDNIDLDPLRDSGYPRKPAVILDLYRAIMLKGFEMEEVVLVMALFDRAVEDYLKVGESREGVRQRAEQLALDDDGSEVRTEDAALERAKRRSRLSTLSNKLSPLDSVYKAIEESLKGEELVSFRERAASRMYLLEKAFLVERISSGQLDVRMQVFGPMLASIFGVTERTVMRQMDAEADALEQGAGATITKIMEGVRRQVAAHRNKSLAGTEEVDVGFIQKEFYSLVADPRALEIVRVREPKSYNLKTVPKAEKGEFFRDQCIWVYAVVATVPKAEAAKVKRSLAMLFGCNTAKIESLCGSPGSEHKPVPSKVREGCSGVDLALRKLIVAPTPERKDDDSLLKLPRAQLFEKVYGLVPDEKARSVAKLFEPEGNGFVLEEGRRFQIGDVFEPKTTRAHRRWVMALLLGAKTEEDRATQVRYISAIFGCGPKSFCFMLNLFHENGKKFFRAETWQDFCEIKKLIGDKLPEIDGEERRWRETLSYSEVKPGNGDVRIAGDRDRAKLSTELLAYQELGFRVGDLAFEGQGDENKRLISLLGDREPEGPASIISASFSPGDFDPEALRKLFGKITLADKAAAKLDFGGVDAGRVSELLAGGGSMPRISPKAEVVGGWRPHWRAMIEEGSLGEAPLPITYNMGLKPDAFKLFEGIPEEEVMEKFRLGMGLFLGFVGKVLKSIFLQSEAADSVRPEFKRFKKETEVFLDVLNEVCVSAFFDLPKATGLKTSRDGSVNMISLETPREFYGSQRKLLGFVKTVLPDLVFHCMNPSTAAAPLVLFAKGSHDRVGPGQRPRGMDDDDFLVYARARNEAKPEPVRAVISYKDLMEATALPQCFSQQAQVFEGIKK